MAGRGNSAGHLHVKEEMPVMLKTVAAMLVFASPALAGTRQDSTVLMPETAEWSQLLEQFGFSEAVVTPDGTIYMSGVVVSLGEDGDFNAAYEATFRYLGSILARAGASWDDVVDITSYHTDLTSQLTPMARVKDRYIKRPFPAWTAIQVARLYPDRGITEIKLVAKISPGK